MQAKNSISTCAVFAELVLQGARHVGPSYLKTQSLDASCPRKVKQANPPALQSINRAGVEQRGSRFMEAESAVHLELLQLEFSFSYLDWKL